MFKLSDIKDLMVIKYFTNKQEQGQTVYLNKRQREILGSLVDVAMLDIRRYG